MLPRIIVDEKSETQKLFCNTEKESLCAVSIHINIYITVYARVGIDASCQSGLVPVHAPLTNRTRILGPLEFKTLWNTRVNVRDPQSSFAYARKYYDFVCYRVEIEASAQPNLVVP